MRPPAFDSRRLASSLPELGHGVRAALRWGAHHTGVPVVVFAGVALVVSWHVFRRTLRLALEVALAVVALLVATHLGWISW
jgi:hypothetical protein